MQLCLKLNLNTIHNRILHNQNNTIYLLNVLTKGGN